MAIFNSYFDITRGYPYYPLVLWHGFGRQPFAIGKSSEKGKTNILIRPTVLLLWWCSINCLQFRSSKNNPLPQLPQNVGKLPNLVFYIWSYGDVSRMVFFRHVHKPSWACEKSGPIPILGQVFGQDQRRPDGWHNMTLKHPLATNKHYPILPLKIPGSQAIQAIQAPSHSFFWLRWRSGRLLHVAMWRW